ncbi:MAG: hypothetical protein AB4058_04035 [Microcystaceae cyanobacterium]
MKYFFLSEGWTYERVWELGGLWNVAVWQRKPHIQQLNLGILEKNEILWLYEVEDAVLMVEVIPTEKISHAQPFGQVILRRLITSDEVLKRLQAAQTVIKTEPLH